MERLFAFLVSVLHIGWVVRLFSDTEGSRALLNELAGTQDNALAGPTVLGLHSPR